MSAVRIVIADDEPVVRQALAALISSEPTLDLVGVAADAAEAVELTRHLKPDVAILDVRMPGGGGATAARGIREISPQTKIVGLSAYGDRDTVLGMIRAGAAGYLVKGAPGTEVIETIARCARGESKLSTEITADVVAELSTHLHREAQASQEREERIGRIREVLDGDGVSVVLQPIADLRSGDFVGFEALSRFPGASAPDVWFAEAEAVGLRTELELHAARAALAALDRLPESAFLAINLSPDVLALQPCNALWPDACDRLVVELTEHAPVADYESLAEALLEARARGARIAVDDTGAGFASLRHILHLAPEFIKLDTSLTRDVEHDRGRRALASALITFASELGAAVVAEGIETEEQLLTLEGLGVRYGQGYFVGRPGPVETFGPRLHTRR